MIILSILSACLGYFSYSYFSKRNKWLSAVFRVHNLLVHFTYIIKECANKEKLKYKPVSLYKNTLISIPKSSLCFWKKSYYDLIKDHEQFDYIIKTVTKHISEFEVFWKIFVKQGIELNNSTILKYVKIISSKNFTATIKDDPVIDDTIILH